MKSLILLAAVATLPVAALSVAAHAQEATLSVSDSYATSTNPKSAAAYMTIANTGASDCTLLGASGTAAEKIELHGHFDEGGVMKMRAIEGGLAIPAGGSRALARGGDHVMLMGLATPLKNGDTVALTLDFGGCGKLPVEVTVDNAYRPTPAMNHGEMPQGDAMGHGAMQHGTAKPAP